jgi:molybdenum cofactor synthesis domain-containing protein
MRFSAAIITISDKGSKGEREDKSGPAIKAIIEGSYTVKDMVIIPDDEDIISETIKRFIDLERVDLVITTGGTGLSRRDVTPEATRAVIERELPGFSEVMRSESYKITPHGIISRGICGTKGGSIVINLPGSPKAAIECFGFIKDAIPHALSKLKGDATDCGTS